MRERSRSEPKAANCAACSGSDPKSPACINAGADGSVSCGTVYFYPPIEDGITFDGSSRIAPPGRVVADTVRMSAGDEPWTDLQGNLLETVLKADGSFGYKGLGIGYSSVTHHRAQILTPRMKAGAFGARCMRFK